MSKLKPCPIKEVFKKFEHLDNLFSDPAWVGVDDEDVPGIQIRVSMFDMWQAIKEFNAEETMDKYVTPPCYGFNIETQDRSPKGKHYPFLRQYSLKKKRYVITIALDTGEIKESGGICDDLQR